MTTDHSYKAMLDASNKCCRILLRSTDWTVRGRAYAEMRDFLSSEGACSQGLLNEYDAAIARCAAMADKEFSGGDLRAATPRKEEG